MDPSLIKELQLEPLSPRGSDFSYSSEPLCSDSSNSSKPPSDSDRSGRNPQPEAKMAVDQSQHRRPPPLDLHQSSEIQDPEKLEGPQFSGLTDSQEEWKSGCFKGDQETDDEHEVKMESAVDKHPIMGKFSSIFRSKSDKDKPNETPVNPYAQQPPSSDTYSSAPAYGGNRGVPSGLPSGPRPGGYGGGLPSGPRPGSSAPPPYSAQNDAAFTDNKKRYDSAASSPSIGYGNDRPGAPSGYGGNRYDNAAGYGQNNNVQAPPPRQGGYGGLSEPNPLFDGRQQRDPYSAMAPPPRPEIPDNYENMTAEEKDDYEAETKKGEIIHTIQETAQSSARARLKAAEGVERMVGMHQMYDRDEAILNKVEQQLDESKHQARLAHAHLDNLDAANSSLFNLAANSKGKLAERSARKAQSEREREIDRDALREEQALRKRELEAATAQVGRPTLGFNKADRSKWAFEDNDGEQEELNNQIDDDMTEIALSVSTMNMLAKGFSVRTDAQINQVTRLTVKSDAAKDKVRAQNNRMKAEYSP